MIVLLHNVPLQGTPCVCTITMIMEYCRDVPPEGTDMREAIRGNHELFTFLAIESLHPMTARYRNRHTTTTVLNEQHGGTFFGSLAPGLLLHRN